MWQLLAIEGGLLVGSFVYHRWIDPPPPPIPASTIRLPSIQQGAPIPLIYGRCRVRTPILAWTGEPHAVPMAHGDDYSPYVPGSPPFLYTMDLYFVLGIPFKEGVNRIHNVWAAEFKMPLCPVFLVGFTPIDMKSCQLSDLDGNSPTIFHDQALGQRCYLSTRGTTTTDGTPFVEGEVEFYNGHVAQTFFDALNAPTTGAGFWMQDKAAGDASKTPAYRGYMSALLYGGDTGVAGFSGHDPSIATASGFTGFGPSHWAVGFTPQLQPMSFEVSSYSGSSPISFQTIGDDANPITVLYDLLTDGPLGKASFDPSMIDLPSWQAAASILFQEGNGYSRVIDETRTGEDICAEILAQIDGALYEDPSTGKIGIKLIRADYDYATLPEIDPDNCESLTYAGGSWTGLPNKIRMTFTDRQNDYIDGSSESINQANAVGQGGVIEVVNLQMPGVCTQTLADTLCSREFSALSRPMARATAVCSRELATLLQGSAVKLRWPEYHASGLVFRVASITRGMLSDGRVTIDLIQDFFFTWRGVTDASSAQGGLGLGAHGLT